MSRTYDNWERLVAATIRREELWQLCHAHSRDTSISSQASDFSFPSPLPNLPFDSLSPSGSSWYQQNSVPSIGTSRWDYNTNEFEGHHRVEAEKSQVLAPEEIFVNGKPLYHEELIMLQICPNPPKKLKPGNYWYDKVSGLWGKEGQKPSQIISSHLNVGGPIKPDASNGKTQVYINCREITKVELSVLKFAGAKCRPDMHFWMHEDGSYKLEERKDILGSIWDKAGMKLLCSVLSLPFPPKPSYTSGKQSAPQKLLLIGCSGSGTSTIFKQAKFLYKEIPFLEDELEHIKVLIQRTLYGYICLLLEGRKQFEEENLKELSKYQSSDEFHLAGHANANNEKSIYSLCPMLAGFSDWLLKVLAAGALSICIPYFSREYAPLFEELLSNAALQETFKRMTELERLPTFANYFLERVADIFKPDYRPSHLDMLYAGSFPSSLSYMDFSFPQSHDDDMDSWYPKDSLLRYQLIRSPAKGFGDNYKWLEMFEDVRIVIMCISLNDYDQIVMDDNEASVNKMMVGRKFFESVVTHPIFEQINVLLLLTKYDLFEEKIKHIPLNQCDWFNDFNPITIGNNSNNKLIGDLGQVGFYYISVKFKRFYNALTGRKLYVARVNCLERDSVDAALKYAREILKWDYEEGEYLDYSTEESFYSDEDTS